MNTIYFTPGPSQLYPTCKKWLRQALREDIPSLSHRSKIFKSLYQDTRESLHAVLGIPKNYHIVFVASATEAMERIIQGSVMKSSFHIISGAFSKKFYDISRELGKNPSNFILDFNTGLSQQVEVPKEAELICFTHNETSNGSQLPLSIIYQIAESHPEKLIAMDVVSSAPCTVIDFTKIDYTFFSVQKGFGLPAGLGVLVISPRGYEKALSLLQMRYSTGSFHSLNHLVETGKKFQTTETPNVLLLYLLGKIAQEMYKKGITSLQEETGKKAEKLYSFLNEDSKFMVTTPEIFRSQTVIVVDHPDCKSIHARLEKKGIIVGKGYGENKDRQIRIANFPAHSLLMVEDLLLALRK